MGNIKLVLFDLGKTLIYPVQPWAEVMALADQAMRLELERSGLFAHPPLEAMEFQAELNRYYDQRSVDFVETSAFSVLDDYLRSKGLTKTPEKVVRSALRAMYAITQKNWQIEEDAIPTLETLKSSGYQIGLLSNAADDLDVQQLVDHWNLRPFFKYTLTSSRAGMRKPHERMFRMALDHFSIPADQAAMVGDILEADILGANHMGIYSIWITRRVLLPAEGELSIQPQAVISRLYQLPDLLDSLDND